MGCILAGLALFCPRLVLFLIFVFGTYLERAFESWFWPFMGFLFMPVTTLAYAWSVNTYGGVSGLGIAAVIVGVLVDFGAIGISGGKSDQWKRRRA